MILITIRIYTTGNTDFLAKKPMKNLQVKKPSIMFVSESNKS